jgi:hypothetical protein
LRHHLGGGFKTSEGLELFHADDFREALGVQN